MRVLSQPFACTVRTGVCVSVLGLKEGRGGGGLLRGSCAKGCRVIQGVGESDGSPSFLTFLVLSDCVRLFHTKTRYVRGASLFVCVSVCVCGAVLLITHRTACCLQSLGQLLQGGLEQTQLRDQHLSSNRRKKKLKIRSRFSHRPFCRVRQQPSSPLPHPQGWQIKPLSLFTFQSQQYRRVTSALFGCKHTDTHYYSPPSDSTRTQNVLWSVSLCSVARPGLAGWNRLEQENTHTHTQTKPTQKNTPICLSVLRIVPVPCRNGSLLLGAAADEVMKFSHKFHCLSHTNARSFNIFFLHSSASALILCIKHAGTNSHSQTHVTLNLTVWHRRHKEGRNSSFLLFNSSGITHTHLQSLFVLFFGEGNLSCSRFQLPKNTAKE